MKDVKIRTWLLAICFLIVLDCVRLPIMAQPKKPSFPTIPLKGTPPPVRGHAYWQEQKKEVDALTNNTWIREQWTGNDAPFAAARAQIEKAENAGQSPLSIVTRMSAQAKDNPNDTLMQFAWAYAVHLAFKTMPTTKAVYDLLFPAELAIARAPQPHTYNYNRLHYLLWLDNAGGLPSYHLKDFGNRLLQKDPHDFPVLMDQVVIYTQNEDNTKKQTGYNLIQDMIKKYPSRPQNYDLLGFWYSNQYLCYHDPINYRQSINYYQKALEMYPRNSGRRADLPAVISDLTERYHQISKV